MRTKRLEKKLVLSKQTIVNLGDGAMNAILGGAVTNEVSICVTKCLTNCDLCPTVYRTRCTDCCIP